AGDRDALDAVYSRLDGKLLLVSARKIPASQPYVAGPTEIGLVSTTMPRLSPPLAKFEGFALVGRDGWVKVHSQPSRSIRESLTLESNGDPALAAALWYRAPGRFDVLYHGRDHRMRVDPIEGSDWSLVSFLDMRGIRAAAAEQFAGAAGLFAIYALLFVLVALLVQIADPRYCAEW